MTSPEEQEFSAVDNLGELKINTMKIFENGLMNRYLLFFNTITTQTIETKFSVLITGNTFSYLSQYFLDYPALLAWITIDTIKRVKLRRIILSRYIKMVYFYFK